MLEKLKLWHITIILFSVCLITYGNSLHNDFMIDDVGMILRDTRMHNIKFINYQLVPDVNRNSNMERVSRDVYYRPVAHVLPLFCYLVFREAPFGYHFVNLVLFFLACLSIFILIKFLFGNKNLALLTSLLFAVHPVNGLFVNYITAGYLAVQIIALSWSAITFLLALEKRNAFFLFFPVTTFPYQAVRLPD